MDGDIRPLERGRDSATSATGSVGDCCAAGGDVSGDESRARDAVVAAVADAIQSRADVAADAGVDAGGGAVCAADRLRECWEFAAGAIVCEKARDERARGDW